MIFGKKFILSFNIFFFLLFLVFVFLMVKIRLEILRFRCCICNKERGES